MKIRIAPIAKCLMATTAGGLMLAQFCGLGFSEAEAQQPSTIQQELQKLYESEGRQAPDMRLESLPRTTPDGRVFEAVPESELPPQAAPVIETPRRSGLLNKLMFWKKNSPPSTVPRVRVAEPNSREAAAPQYQTGGQPSSQNPQRPQSVPAGSVYQAPPQQPRTYQQPRPLPTNPALQAAPSNSGQIPVRPVSQPRQLPINTATQPHPLALPAAPPAEFEERVPTAPPFPVEAKRAADLPDLDALPDEPLPLVTEPPKPPEQPQPRMDELFPDPFTEVSEAAADGSRGMGEIPRLNVKPETPSADLPRQEPLTPAPSDQLPKITPKGTPTPSQANPFIESEPKAAEPAKNSPLESTNEPSENENPFSGLKLEPATPIEPKVPLIEEQAPTAGASDAVKPGEVRGARKTDLPEGSALDLPIDESENAKSRSASQAPGIPDIEPSLKNEFDLPGTRGTSEQPLPEMPKLEKIPHGNDAGEPGNFSWEEEQARQAAKLKLIAARKGETGLKGFCIVSLRDDRELKDALPQFRSTYNLRTYHFSNLESKIEFDKNPKKYVPSYDGNDPVLLSTESEEREGSLDTALWFKGRLYLFIDQDNMKSFQNDPVLYAEN